MAHQLGPGAAFRDPWLGRDLYGRAVRYRDGGLIKPSPVVRRAMTKTPSAAQRCLTSASAIAPTPAAGDSPPVAAVHRGWSRQAAVPAVRKAGCTTATGAPAPGRAAGRVKRRPHLTQNWEAGSSLRDRLLPVP